MNSPVDPTDTTSSDTAALVVIGGGPAGRSAAAAYREAGGTGRVVLITAEDTPPYRRPPLSKGFLAGTVPDDEMLQRPAADYQDQSIELWLSEPVTGLDTAARRVRTASGREITYGAVVVATGCAAVVPSFDGGDHPAVARLRSLEDGRFLRAAAGDAARAVVIGSGFIGCEAAATLARRGLSVTMVTSEELPQLTRLGRPVADRIAGWLRRRRGDHRRRRAGRRSRRRRRRPHRNRPLRRRSRAGGAGSHGEQRAGRRRRTRAVRGRPHPGRRPHGHRRPRRLRRG